MPAIRFAFNIALTFWIINVASKPVIFAAERPNILWQLGGHTARIHDVAVSPNGALAASASDDGTLKVWDIVTGRLDLTVTLPTDNFNPPFGMYGVSFDPDGQSIWATSVGGGYRWRLSDGELLDSIIAMESAGQVFFSRDNQYIGLAGSPSGSEDTTQVYRRSDGMLVHSFEPAGSTAAVFSADGQYIIAGNSVGFGGVPGVIRYYRMSDGGLERAINAHGDIIMWLALSPDGATLASCSWDHQVKLWNAADGSFIRTLSGHSNIVYRVRFSPDGSRLASSSYDGTIRIWNVATGDQIDSFAPTDFGVGGMDWRPSGQSLIVGSAAQFGEQKRTLQEFDLQNGATVREFLSSDLQVFDISLSLDGTRIGVGLYGQHVQVRNAVDGSLVWSSTNPAFGNMVAFTADGSRLAAAGDDGQVRFYNAANGEPQQSILAHTGFFWISDIAFSPDGQTMVTRKFGQNGRIWNYPALTLRAELIATNQSLGQFAFMPDSQSFAATGPHGVLMLRSSNGTEIQYIPGHSEATTDVAISADGQRMISGSRDYTARLWNPNTGAFLRSFTGHENVVESVAISPDGSTVATGTIYTDRSLRIWNAETGDLLVRYSVDTGTGIGGMMFTPDGQTLICRRNDGTLMAIRNPAIPAAGDVDGDGDVDVADGAALAAVLVDQPLDPEHVGRGDVNGDGTRDGRDVNRLVEILLGP